MEVALGELVSDQWVTMKGQGITIPYHRCYKHCPTSSLKIPLKVQKETIEAVHTALQTGMWAGLTGYIEEKLAV